MKINNDNNNIRENYLKNNNSVYNKNIRNNIQESNNNMINNNKRIYSYSNRNLTYELRESQKGDELYIQNLKNFYNSLDNN